MSTVTNTLVRAQPTFLFIGADRCGSKSLHNIFRQHPDCYVPAIADPYFFDRTTSGAWIGIWTCLPPPRGQSARSASFRTTTFIRPAAAERIASHFPDVQLLASLRHPIERTFSSYASACSAGVIRTSFEQAVEEVPMLVSGSLYADKLRIYYDWFPPEQLKVLFFDDLEADPRAFAGEAFKFLGLPVVDEIDYGKRMSVLSRSRFPFSGPLSKLGAHALRRLGWVNLLGSSKATRGFARCFTSPTQLATGRRFCPETRKRLGEVFAPQIDALEEMLGRDLSAWRT